MALCRTFLFAVLSLGALANLAAAASPQPGYILLINRPKFYTEPTTASKAIETGWSARHRMTVIDRQKETDAATTNSMSGWYLVQPEKEKNADQGWAPGVYLAPPPQALAEADPTSIGQERVDRWHGLPPDYAPKDLESVGPRYDKDIDYKMRHEAAVALKKMIAVAKSEGIAIQVTSAYRAWDLQQSNYQNKLKTGGWGQNVIARPGHSEHQLGTAVDLTDGDEKTYLASSFADSQAGKWLRANAPKFGFAQSYTEHNQPETGYAPEPWHFRYWGIAQAAAKHAAALGTESGDRKRIGG